LRRTGYLEQSEKRNEAEQSDWGNDHRVGVSRLQKRTRQPPCKMLPRAPRDITQTGFSRLLDMEPIACRM
jgi:hypothetical protein